MQIIITDDDREQARYSMVVGWNNCKETNRIGHVGKLCDCDLRTVDGCKARIEAIAREIAIARKI